MTLWLLVPLFALAQASCYDYEYYDPETGASLPGNACARQQAAAAAGQPVAQVGTTQTFGTPVVATTTFGTPATSFATPAVATTTFGTATTFGTPIAATATYGTPIAATATTYGTPVAAATTYGTPFAATATYGTPIAATTYGTAALSTPVVAATSFAPYATSSVIGTPIAAPVYGTAAIVAPAAVTTVSAPAVTVRAAATTQGKGNANTQKLSAELEYYKQLGEEQQRQHKQNKRIVDRASRELQRGSLVNTLVAGSGNAASWYPAFRLSKQRDAAGAYKSEARIANKNAEDAYRRYVENPTRLNLLVSKYQDLNADLRDSAYHYNVVNSATFGQTISRSSIFSLGGSGLLSGLTQIISQRQISDDLNGIQRQMQRVARQIQDEVKIASGQASGQAQVQAQGSVQQRMMAMNLYGPQQTRNVRG